jgi:hypothetical protein
MGYGSVTRACRLERSGRPNGLASDRPAETTQQLKPYSQLLLWNSDSLAVKK